MTVATTADRGSDHAEREREHFDRLAEACGETWWGHLTRAGVQRMRRRVDLLAAWLEGCPDPHVLEIGCGAGMFTRAILERFPTLRLTAWDISPKSVALAHDRCGGYPNLRLAVADVMCDDHPCGVFDAIVGNSILHHLPIERYLPLAWRLLKPGGFVWFSEPNMLNPQIAVEKNVRWVGRRLQNTEDETAFFRWSLRRIMERRGFHDVRIEPYDFLHPAVPAPFIGLVDWCGRIMESVPVVREIAGSLHITARRPLLEKA